MIKEKLSKKNNEFLSVMFGYAMDKAFFSSCDDLSAICDMDELSESDIENFKEICGIDLKEATSAHQLFAGLERYYEGGK